ncbi:hypothetical protein CI424_21765 [Salmonella enterica subsp. enterica serovar Enteritidis]|nr:hypothetical protein [Salmonella enterica subsp. enterica serovar Enteritidis]
MRPVPGMAGALIQQDGVSKSMTIRGDVQAGQSHRGTPGLAGDAGATERCRVQQRLHPDNEKVSAPVI